MIVWRKSTVWPLASVSRPSSNTCRNRSQALGCAFSNSSSRTTENGCLARDGEGVASRLLGIPEDLARGFDGLELAHVQTNQPVG